MDNEKRLTRMADIGGCGAKLGPSELRAIMEGLVAVNDSRLIVGLDTFDDGAVIRLRNDLALVFTADIITPVVDNPFDWGMIAAANALSDIYAMGGTPLCAINISCFPSCLSLHVMREVLSGGQAVATEANCMIVGGHTLVTKEPKYGMAVIGTAHPDNVVTKKGAKPGDLIYLSKFLGTGVVVQAIKMGIASDQLISAASKDMMLLNRDAAEAALSVGVRALTDVTGFGLIGHLCEMIGPKNHPKVVIRTSALPILPDTLLLLRKGILSGVCRGRAAFMGSVTVQDGVDSAYELLCYHPLTSGGLLCVIPPEKAEAFEIEAARRNVQLRQIGTFETGSGIVLCP